MKEKIFLFQNSILKQVFFILKTKIKSQNDKNKILEYFDKVEKLQKNKDQKDILKFKKALFLLKNFEKKDANKLFKELINTNSKIKNLAEEILSN